MTLRSLQGNGWKIIDQATLEIDWDSKENVETVRHRVALLTKGCNCKIGCHTARCGCVKRNGKCGAECNCQNCCNLPIPSISEDLVDMAIAERTNRNHDEEVDDIMLALFGECSSFIDDSDQSDNEEPGTFEHCHIYIKTTKPKYTNFFHVNALANQYIAMVEKRHPTLETSIFAYLRYIAGKGKYEEDGKVPDPSGLRVSKSRRDLGLI